MKPNKFLIGVLAASMLWLCVAALPPGVSGKFIHQYPQNPAPPLTYMVLEDPGDGNYQQSTLAQILTISGGLFLATNGVGQNPTFYGGGSFFGAYYFDEVDAKNFYPTNLFTGDTNFLVLGTDGNGQFVGRSATGSGFTVVLTGGPTITNALIKGDQYGTNAFFITTWGVVISNNINQVVISNGTIYATGPITVTGDTNSSLAANQFKITDGNKGETTTLNGNTLTNLTYAYNTNIVGAANFVFGQAYWTNASSNFTFPALTENPNVYETLVVTVTNSGAATITATINGVAGAPGHVVPAVFYCTNATVTEIDVSHFGILWTNACVGKN